MVKCEAFQREVVIISRHCSARNAEAMMSACGDRLFLTSPPSLLCYLLNLFRGTMATSRAFLSLPRPLGPRATLNGSICPMCRGLATAGEAVSPTLPLAGIRVLDMTRVLAGVCLSSEARVGS